MNHAPSTEASCPLALTEQSTVQLAHGGGGRMSQRLVEELFLPALENPTLAKLQDSAVLGVGTQRLAFSTDSFVVKPLFFPGGNIGSLAVHGTVNDLAMSGARPLALSAGYILEEGYPLQDLWHIARSMQLAAKAAGVSVVTGDTKVVHRGQGDGVYINTSGIGLVPEGIDLTPSRVRVGDRILLSGEIASHGIAIMSVREGLGFESTLQSDSTALHMIVQDLLQAVDPEAVHVLRDPTRGGVASALNEIISNTNRGILLEEGAIPVQEEVRGACEILGLDPLYVANEGKFLAFVAPQAADAALASLRSNPLGRDAAIVGEVVSDHPGRVFLENSLGGKRLVDMMSGEQLPRIC